MNSFGASTQKLYSKQGSITNSMKSKWFSFFKCTLFYDLRSTKTYFFFFNYIFIRLLVHRTYNICLRTLDGESDVFPRGHCRLSRSRAKRSTEKQKTRRVRTARGRSFDYASPSRFYQNASLG